MDYKRRMIEVRETPEFTRWLTALKDQRAILHIVRRISRVAAGNPGDAKSVGGPVMELRIDHGPGYRAERVNDSETVQV